MGWHTQVLRRACLTRSLPGTVLTDPYRLKKSSQVDLGLVAALALSLTGCSQMQRCVDDQNVVAPDQFCTVGITSSYHWGVDPSGQRHCFDANNSPVSDAACLSTIGRHYHWYYGGRGSYTPGSTAYGGGEFPRSGTRYSTSSGGHSGGGEESGGTSRGGFGRSGGGGRGA